MAYGWDTSSLLAQKELIGITEKAEDIVALSAPLYSTSILMTTDREHPKVEKAVNDVLNNKELWSHKTIAWTLRAQWRFCEGGDARYEREEAYKALKKTSFNEKTQQEIRTMLSSMWKSCSNTSKK